MPWVTTNSGGGVNILHIAATSRLSVWPITVLKHEIVIIYSSVIDQKFSGSAVVFVKNVYVLRDSQNEEQTPCVHIWNIDRHFHDAVTLSKSVYNV